MDGGLDLGSWVISELYYAIWCTLWCILATNLSISILPSLQT